MKFSFQSKCNESSTPRTEAERLEAVEIKLTALQLAVMMQGISIILLSFACRRRSVVVVANKT
jgi:hypothetical protein